jgi:hypothetical protein
MGVGNTVQAPRLVVHTASKPSVVKSSLSHARRRRSTVTHSMFAVKSSASKIKALSSTKRVHFGDSCFVENCSAASGTASEISSAPSPSTDLSLTTIIHHIPSNQDIDDHQRSLLWWTKEERRDIQSRNQAMIQDYLQRHPLHVRHLRQVFEEQCCHYSAPSTTLSDSIVVNVNLQDDHVAPTEATSPSSSEESDNDDDNPSNDPVKSDSFELRCQQRCRRRHRLHHPSSSLHALCQKRQQRQHQLDSNSMMILPICVRGLEYGILPDAKSHRKAHRQRILDWQERLRTMEKTKNHDNDNDSTVSSHFVLEQQSSLSSLRSRRLAQLLAASDASGGDCNNGKPTAQSHAVIPYEYGYCKPPSKRRLSMMASSSTSSSSVRQCRPRMIPTTMW